MELPRDTTIVAAVSRLALNTNQNTLRCFRADSPLTEEAREVIYKHPDLCSLLIVISKSTILPTIILPNLTNIEIEYEKDDDWQQVFHGASLGKLASVKISSNLDSVGNFLGEFANVTLATSIPTTLSEFMFYTRTKCSPDYRSLLPFTQLQKLDIDFTCRFGCSSTIDDATITDLAQAMPKLEVLRLGDRPCETPAGVTMKGLASLAYYCPHLFDLLIHFQVTGLDLLTTPRFASVDESVPRVDCALPFLQVGCIRVPEGSALIVASTLLKIFPNLNRIQCFLPELGWEEVWKIIKDSRPRPQRSSKK